MHITFGSRNSKWALAATNVVVKLLNKHFPDISVQVLPLDTPGDSFTGNLVGMGGTKSFVDKISLDVASGKIDAAVHTVKDISWPDSIELFPSGVVSEFGLATSNGLIIPAVSSRVDPRDALLFRADESFETLEKKSEIVVGTSSLVRSALIQKIYPDKKLTIKPIRGNVDLRLNKLDAGEYDVLILSMDGLIAIGQENRANIIFDIDQMPPAPGQGIGAVEIRADNLELVKILNKISDAETMLCLRAEWALMKALNADCNTPLGGICQVEKKTGDLLLSAQIVNFDGETVRATARQHQNDQPELLGNQVANLLIKNGAKQLTASWIGVNESLSQDAC